MIGRLNIKRRGGVINGLIEQYKVTSGGNISAGDFVKYVGDITKNTQIEVNLIKEKVVNSIDANATTEMYLFEVNNNQIFLIVTTGNIYYSGVVLNFKDNDVEIGKSTQFLVASDFRCYQLNNNTIITIDDDVLFQVIHINTDNTFTVSEQITLDSNASGSNYIDIEILSPNQFLIVYAGISPSNIYAVFGTVTDNSTSLTLTDKTLIYGGSASNISIHKKDDNNLIILLPNGQAMVECTISNNVISVINTMKEQKTLGLFSPYSFNYMNILVDNLIIDLTNGKAIVTEITSDSINKISEMVYAKDYLTWTKNCIKLSPTRYLFFTNSQNGHLSQINHAKEVINAYYLDINVEEKTIQISDPIHIKDFETSRYTGDYSGFDYKSYNYVYSIGVAYPSELTGQLLLVYHTCNNEQGLGKWYYNDIQVNLLKLNLDVIPTIGIVESENDRILGVAKKTGKEGQVIDVYIPKI